MTKIIMFRHAHSMWNQEAEGHAVAEFGGRKTGCLLSPKGKWQASLLPGALIEWGIKPDAVFSSTAKRALGTAEPTAEAFGLEIQHVPELEELSWGDLEGLPRTTQREERLAQGFAFCPTNGESHDDVRERGLRELWKISKLPYDCVLVFTHQNVIKNTVRAYKGWRDPMKMEAFKLGVCSATTVEPLSPNRLRVIQCNRTLI